MKIEQWLIIRNSEHLEKTAAIANCARGIQLYKTDSIISTVFLNTNDIAVTDPELLRSVDGILFCPYVSIGYVSRVVKLLKDVNNKEVFIITNTCGDYIKHLTKIAYDTELNIGTGNHFIDDYVMSIAKDTAYNVYVTQTLPDKESQHGEKESPNTIINIGDPGFYNKFVLCGSTIDPYFGVPAESNNFIVPKDCIITIPEGQKISVSKETTELFKDLSDIDRIGHIYDLDFYNKNIKSED